MPLFKKKHADEVRRSSFFGRFGLTNGQIMSAAAMVTAGVAVSAVISGIPVGVRQALAVSADASYEEQLYNDFAPADVDILKEHNDASVHELSVLVGQLANMSSFVEETSFGPIAEYLAVTSVETIAAMPQMSEDASVQESVPEQTEVQTEPQTEFQPEPNRSNEPVVSSNKNLYKDNYCYGADSLSHSGGAGLNSSGIAMSELTIPDSLQFDENGAPVNYSYYIDCYATAYTNDGITATGTATYQGCVAVDPREIPYGTEMWIVSLDGRYVYGYCRAEDTGGFIYYTNGATVDLFMYSESDCDNWGFRGVRVYILPASY